MLSKLFDSAMVASCDQPWGLLLRCSNKNYDMTSIFSIKELKSLGCDYEATMLLDIQQCLPARSHGLAVLVGEEMEDYARR